MYDELFQGVTKITIYQGLFTPKGRRHVWLGSENPGFGEWPGFRTCKIRTGKGERSEPAGKNHTAADPQVSSVHLRSALIRGAKTRPGGLDPHWHRQTAKKSDLIIGIPL